MTLMTYCCRTMTEEAPAEVPPPEGEEAGEPEPVELPPACMDLSDFLPKIDFFDNMVVIDEKSEKIEGANNFRQVNGFPVFGTGQTTEEGFLKVLDKVKAVHGDDAGEKILWFNMRKVKKMKSSRRQCTFPCSILGACCLHQWESICSKKSRGSSP